MIVYSKWLQMWNYYTDQNPSTFYGKVSVTMILEAATLDPAQLIPVISQVPRI
jgi:hypothetical protein